MLTRDTNWHRTPSLFYKQEKNSLLLILTSNVTEHVNIHIIGSLVKRGASSPPITLQPPDCIAALTLIEGDRGERQEHKRPAKRLCSEPAGTM